MHSPTVRRGIAVIELVVVLLIVGVLLAIAIPRFTRPTLTVVSGPGATVPAGASGPLAVRVTSWRGAAQAGVPVAFEGERGIAVTPAVVRTDSTGTAVATWLAGPTAGARTIVAHVEGRETPRLTIETRATGARPAASPAAPTGADTGRSDTARLDSTAAGAVGTGAATTPR